MALSTAFLGILAVCFFELRSTLDRGLPRCDFYFYSPTSSHSFYARRELLIEMLVLTGHQSDESKGFNGWRDLTGFNSHDSALRKL
jgi:hypothetical protein